MSDSWSFDLDLCSSECCKIIPFAYLHFKYRVVLYCRIYNLLEFLIWTDFCVIAALARVELYKVKQVEEK